MEEIQLNLPVKSLLCFSSVSKSWNSAIFESGFVKRYRRRAALPGGERIVLVVGDCSIFDETSLLSYIPSNNPAVTDFVCPFSKYPIVEASCDDMWLVRVDVGESQFLWNPSMRSNYKKVPTPLKGESDDYFLFGLGYESVGDDYKILKIPGLYERQQYEAELYSLRSDSWRIIPHLPKHMHSVIGECVFVSGKLHWMTDEYSPDEEDADGYPFRVSIICFDLLTEKFGEVVHPNLSPFPVLQKELCVLRGMLCVSIDAEEACEIWVMEEYGVAGSWTKKFSIPYLNSVFGFDSIKCIKPLYCYENGEILMIVSAWSKDTLCVYKDEKTRAKEVAIDSCYKTIYTGFVYFDSLVAPTMHAART